MATLPGSHQPSRPAWVCARCFAPFPCLRARAELIAELGLTAALGRHAYRLLEGAVRDLPDLTLTELWDRFVAWTEPAPNVMILPAEIGANQGDGGWTSGWGQGFPR